jgi:hypothetical protein
LKKNAKKNAKKNVAEKGSGGNEFRKYNNRLLMKGKVKISKISKLPSKSPVKKYALKLPMNKSSGV